MRKMGWRGIAALGLLGVASFAAAQPPKSKAMPPGFWNDVFRPKAKQDDKKDEKPKLPPSDRKAESVSPARSAEQDRLMKAYLRRLAVCDRLRDIALEKDDPTLADEAAQLDAMAWELYQEQSAKLLSDERVAESEEPKAAVKQASARGGKAGALPSRFRTGGLSAGTASGESREQEGDR